MARRVVVLAVLVFALAGWTTAASSGDASSAWNELASSFNFCSVPTPTPWTFKDAYAGSDFETDFRGILSAVAQLMGTSVPPVNGDDLLNYSIQSWPDP